MIKEVRVCDFCGKMDEEMNTVVLPIIKTDTVRATKDGRTLAVHTTEKIENEAIDLCPNCNKIVAVSVYDARGKIDECGDK